MSDELPEGAEPTPPGVRTMGVIRWILVALAALVAAYAWIAFARTKLGATSTVAEHRPRYICPMHPQVVSDFPGECPICHMSLEPLEPSSASPAASGPGGGILDDSGPARFECPMHPEVRSASPARCPVCKMKLEPIAAGDGGAAPEAPGGVPSGTTAIRLGLDRIQSIGVRTAVAEEAVTSAPLRVTAVVQPPEQGTAEVHVRTPGFVESIRVDQTGVAVGAGQPLLTLYSPEILQAQQELLAMRAWTDASVSPARSKLELLGVSAADIDAVLAKREPIRAITIAAPRAGFVTKKNVVLGSYVTPETTLYEIQDLSRVYVVADVFLADVPHVKVGAEARFTPSGHPEGAGTGKVDLVYPLVSAEARTRRIRMQLPNAGGRAYAPGEFGVVELVTPTRRGVTIPRDALIDTGRSTYVFVVEAPAGAAEQTFVPRSVTTSGGGDRVTIASGLAGATFLIDSESRLQASVAAAAGHHP